MTLKSLLAEGRLRPHKTTPKEIGDLFFVVERDLKDAAVTQLSEDRRFATAYNALLGLATIVLYAAGCRTAGAGHHWMTFSVLPELLGPSYQSTADYFDTCRTKRNLTDYDRAGEISGQEAEEILKEARAFKLAVIQWLKKHHKGLL
ncbi:MAG: hypothetical protein ACOY3K_03260 [Candidatus Omnitrophota bacterium]